jgi:hypothetical protein
MGTTWGLNPYRVGQPLLSPYSIFLDLFYVGILDVDSRFGLFLGDTSRHNCMQCNHTGEVVTMPFWTSVRIVK